MAVLAPQDWQPPRDHQMDIPSQNNVNPSGSRPRSSPANDSPVPSPVSASQSPQPYPYPVQQQQAAWSPQAQPFYPAFYQNPHQQPYPIHPAHPAQQGPMPQQPQYFDPNAQLAQWAYQHMIFNAHQQAHQQQLSHGSPNHSPHSQRSRPSNPASPNDYFQQPQQLPPGFNSFPSGTPPPPHPNQLPAQYRISPNNNPQNAPYDSFHPYRRPNRTGSQQSDQPPQQQQQQQPPPGANQDWRQPQPPFQPPYARADANNSSSSLNSTNSQRQRTSSLQGSSSSGGGGGRSTPPQHHSNQGSTSTSRSRPPTATHGRVNSSSSTSPAGAPSQPAQRVPHTRNLSSSSTSSNNAASARLSPNNLTSPSSGSSLPLPRPAKPSPLSQASSMSVADKRRSRDDSEMELPTAAQLRAGGLKGRLRRALSLSAAQAISEQEEDDASPPKGSASRMNGKDTASSRAAVAASSSDTQLQSNAALQSAGDNASTATRKVKKSRKALFNSRLNASTDNISLSSTMSSASVVIRKLGSIGKLARRNSLAGITSVFKGKKDKEDEDDAADKKGAKKKKGSKADAAEVSVSYLTAEQDRNSSEWGPELSGLSPAARLARQHTLKSNADAAAKAKQQQEEATAAAAPAQTNGENVPTTWEKNSTTRQGESPGRTGAYRVNEEGMRVIVEDDDSASDGESQDRHDHAAVIEGWEEDDWGREDEEDATVRQSLEQASIAGDDDLVEPWAVNVRRSVERTLRPSRGILKNADKYDQRIFLDSNRQRSNSYNSPAQQTSELGPLARIPSPDPDHIDGLHRHGSHSSNHSTSGNGQAPTFSLPPFSFDTEGGTESPGAMSDAEDDPARPQPEKTLFSHPNLNSSAPVLSTMLSTAATLPRSATVPAKRLTFANNLHVYDTFPATVYDRRSEPATWSRLTPALAQRIKEELNSYKMEEMEVHAASRIHTQFFV